MAARVAIIRCGEYDRKKVRTALYRCFELLGGIERFVKAGDNVLIKPNLIAPKSPRYPTQTHPAMIVETARLLKDFGAKPFVADSPAWGSAANCIRTLRIDEELKTLGVPVRELDKPKSFDISGHRIKISNVAAQADAIINLPKFKSHQQLVATFAIKNMFGCVPGKRKAYWHFAKGKQVEDFCTFLVAIYKFLNPAITIVDAVTVMEGPGPINGQPRPLGFILASADPAALEVICAQIISLDPNRLPLLQAARRAKLGTSNSADIETLGDDYRPYICTDFKHAELIPVRFSLPRICKSTLKQIRLLLAEKLKK
ncbi:MAG: DUF362 domain-containing protein [Phycisphaerae bacterium]|nr:DUF362 domain-containing protein [Phycisphaerae bacterium]